MRSSQRGESKKCHLCRQKSVRQSVKAERAAAESEEAGDGEKTSHCSDCSEACADCKSSCIECHRFKWVSCDVKGCRVHFPPEDSMTKIRIMTPQPKKTSSYTKLKLFCCSSSDS